MKPEAVVGQTSPGPVEITVGVPIDTYSDDNILELLHRQLLSSPPQPGAAADR